MAELIVNTGALLQNYRRYADAGQVIPILKGNGYGLGAQPLRDLLARQGVTLFACATPEEALALLAYMVQHNRHHAEELHELAHSMEDEPAQLIHDAILDFNLGNEKLDEALKLLKGE